ncbi:MAG TPA: 3-deoxy-D-manno-octulosonic acid kinase [Steroidobacteraceae bacterium]|nr:3-deoxy-D-manno-octulosonic acid kinase [Steroidobacteraceae bacterium]
MLSIQEGLLRSAGGGILYDASRLRKPAGELFDVEHWRAQGSLQEIAGGRGAIAVINTAQQPWVLRHYRRGGFIARFSRDRYLFVGEDRTRSFAEWRLLAELRRRGLPVPAPVAARYVRGALTYTADLITEQLPDCRTLADAITGAQLSAEQWSAIGKTITAFHREGVHHADLNAHNIMIEHAVAPRVYLLDFDRGRIRPRGAWEQEVLARLRRSLEKIKAQRPGAAFGEAEWQSLLSGSVGS